MTDTIPVTPGIDMTRALGDQRLTKTWLREYLRTNPEKDFRNQSMHHRGAYVNGDECVDHDLTLEVHRPTGEFVAVVVFKRQRDTAPAPAGQSATPNGETRLVAVVR